MAAVTVGSLVSVTGAAATTLTSGSIDASSGTDQCLVVGTVSSASTGANATGVTWDVGTPENFTARPSVTGFTFYGTDLWSLVGITVATDTVTATWSSAPDDMCLYVRELENVNQTTPIGDTDTDTDTNGDVTITLTGQVTGDLLIDCYGSNSGNAKDVGANQTERVEIVSAGSYPMGLAMSEQAGADGGVMSYGNEGTEASLYCAMVIKQTAAGGANPKGPLGMPLARPFNGPF